LEDIRSEKAIKFKELSKHKNGKEYQQWFLKYIPGNKSNEKNKTRKLNSTIEKEVEMPTKKINNEQGFLF
jgi:hypothetical protein